MIKTKSGILESRLLSSQLEQSEKFSKTSDWLKKAGPPKKHFCFDHVNRLSMIFMSNLYKPISFPKKKKIKHIGHILLDII